MKVYDTSGRRSFIGRLDCGADLLESVKKLVEERDVKAAVFWLIGAVKKAKLAYYDQTAKKFAETVIEERLEITSCVGNVSQFKGQTRVHAHISLADEKGRGVGGHLCEGTTVFAAEFYLLELEAELNRERDETTGLDLF